MFAVIFKAEPDSQDEAYAAAVARMRQLAFEKYDCKDFISVTEGDTEIAISYWQDEDAIKRWKNDAEHLLAQQSGRSKWYKSYTVQVLEIKREYNYQN